MAVDEASRNKDNYTNEILRLRKQVSTLQYEGVEEMKPMDEINQRKLLVMSEEREDYRSRTVAQEAFINAIREQLRKAHEELGKNQQAIVVSRHNSASVADQRMAEMKMNMLEKSVQRKEALTEKLQSELLESNAIEAQLRASMRHSN